MKIKLAGNKISNFGELFQLGQSVDAEIIGYIDHKIDAYEIMIDGNQRAALFSGKQRY